MTSKAAMILEGSKAPDITLLHTDGQQSPLSTITGGAPSVFFFLRHYA